MAAPPRLTKLGAKWVEVRRRRARLPKRPERILKTWPATPVEGSLRSLKELSKLVAVASLGASRGRPAIQNTSISRADKHTTDKQSKNYVVRRN